ncbi:hypothetical protein KIMH_08850 [Bombiscardovia apis]|uniref:beta-N-acetylhexosaminidase n=1 Tax=Bombiscardovia apis TaxID=2932182 RepID=A0ABN6SGE7_9BIFI|nr:glycoside hydrolase family 20 zincin-like fold domain-containing protein [Bombiscardovia apis]BDR54774.1 hypothetical protein KIMH_08850 [Bombiscardovia apis]
MSQTVHTSPSSTASSTQLALIPQPSKLSITGSPILMPCQGRISYQGPQENSFSSTGNFLAQELASDIEESTGFSWQCAQGSAWKAWISLQIDSSLAAQEYRIVIDERQPSPVNLIGGDMEGLRYAVQTLRQIFKQSAPLLPQLRIEDKPVFAVRSYSLDVTRGRVPTMAWLKAWANKLAYYKYNQLQLYIEHTFAFDGMSESWRGTSPLQPQDIIEFDTYCAQLGIELVPSLSTFGHHYMTLRTQTYRRLGEFPQDAERPYSFIERQEHHTLNVADQDAFAFSCAIIDAYAPLFRTKKFNIGGDETFDLGKGQSKVLAEQVGVEKLYADYVVKLCQHVEEQGREPMFWGDIAVSTPKVLDRLPKDNPLLNWLYSPEVDDEKVKMVADMGLPQYVCSAVQAWNGLLPKVHDAWSNIYRLNQYGLQYGAVGAMITDWGDYGHINDPVMSIPGMVYGAQYSWNPQGPGFDQMNRLMDELEYGDRQGKYVEALVEASEAVAFSWGDMVTYMELDDGQGSVNTDVSSFLASIHTKEEWSLEDITSLSQARTHYLELILDKLKDASNLNQRLDQASKQLASVVAGSSLPASQTGQAQLLSVEGQRLFNLLGLTLASKLGLTDTQTQSGLPSPEELASELENWFEGYRARWRRVSKESELRRISAIVWSYADMLRR